MSDMNTCTFSGRLAKDPELKYTQNNKAYCRFPIAVNRYDGREEKEVADFFDCLIWDKQAEFLANYFGKGDQVFVTANARKNIWEDNERRKHYDVEFVVRSFVGGRKKGDGGHGGRPEPESPYQGQSNAQNNNGAQTYYERTQQQSQQSQQPPEPGTYPANDVPF